MHLFLIRHGQTDWNVSGQIMGRTDIPLNLEGKSQVCELAQTMGSIPLEGIFSSPQLRAQQTAQAISKTGKIFVQTDPNLSEVDFHSWMGQDFEKIRNQPDFIQYQNSFETKEDSRFETLLQVQHRVKTFAEGLVQKNPEGFYAMVSHGDPIRILLGFALGQPLKDFYRIRVANASVSLVLWEKGQWFVTLINFRRNPDFQVKN